MTLQNVSPDGPAVKAKRLLKGPAFRARLGHQSRTTFWRLSKEDPDFPKPVMIRGRPYFEETEADAYIEILLARREVP